MVVERRAGSIEMMSPYMRRLRDKIGHDLVFVSAAGTYVFDSARRVLLIRHADGGRWTNPGGMVEPFETPADAPSARPGRRPACWSS